MLAAVALALAPCAAAPAPEPGDEIYEQDVAFALDELEKQVGHFFESKDVDWKEVRKEFTKAAKEVASAEDHRVNLTRLLARVKDGHAAVVPTKKAEDVGWPEDLAERWESETGPGMFWCKVGKKLYVKNAWSSAAEVGVEPGMEIVKVDGEPAMKWLDAWIAGIRDMRSFSTDQQAFFFACHWGLAQPKGTRMKLELKTPKGKKTKKTITYEKANPVPQGPAFFPADIEVRESGQKHGLTPKGYGYVHVRRVPSELPEEMDEILAALGDVPGLILDFRGNSGGGTDHDALFGRFIQEGEKLQRAGAYELPSAGPNPYAGPIVVIVDGTVRSSGETAAGMLSEDGRAYMIGESPTAGMSAQKTTIELPSGLFGLYVATASNKGRFNGGRGIEGVGVIPHEIVEYDPADLAAGRDTLIAYAETLLDRYPKKPWSKVPYDPSDHGFER